MYSSTLLSEHTVLNDVLQISGALVEKTFFSHYQSKKFRFSTTNLLQIDNYLYEFLYFQFYFQKIYA
jgi:hypothetical protein